jgi:alpha-mannosidase
VVLEVAKRAYDRPDSLVVRLYEAWGSRGPVTLTAPWPVARATRTDLLERDLEPVASTGPAVQFDLAPFEIITVRLDR